MAGRRSRSQTGENRAVTPEGFGRDSPRSRKCLRLDPKLHGSPVGERSSVLSPMKERVQFTPLKGEKSKLGSGMNSVVEKGEVAGRVADIPEPSSPEIFPRTPSQFSSITLTQVATPKSFRTPLRSLMINTPTRRKSSSRTFSIPEQYKQAPLSSRKQEPKPQVQSVLPKIETSSFYKSVKPEAEDDNQEKRKKVIDRSQSEPRKPVSKGVIRDNLSRKSRKSFGGVKRKREGVNKGGFGHAIKRPKKKPKIDIKISQLPAMSIEIPGSKNALKTPKPAKKAVTPKTGNFSLSKERSVDYEVKGGQVIYRRGGSTPVRRSPRKNMSPLKQCYFEGSKPKSRSNGKLFSPSADFLTPERSSPQKFLPSPVKFTIAPDDDETETNISDLIDQLGEEEEEDEDIYLDPGLQLDLAPGRVVSTQFIEQDPEMTAFKAVQDILGEISADDSTGNSSASQAGEDEELDEDGKLFPIFYKSSADSGTEPGTEITKPRGRRGFICQDPNQLQIDAGQTRGPTLCLTCGAVYTIGDPEDEASHEKSHNGIVDRLKFPGWKNERNCGEYENGRIVMVQPGDPRHMWRKVEDALTVVDRDLGFSEVGIRYPEKTKVFLYISEKKIAGFLLAESIENGFRVVTQKQEGGKVYMCSETPNPVKCGVSRIWVLADFRRKRIASRLVESMRASFLLGHPLAQDEFAFSDPTLNGMDFAINYMKRADFLVYNR